MHNKLKTFLPQMLILVLFQSEPNQIPIDEKKNIQTSKMMRMITQKSVSPPLLKKRRSWKPTKWDWSIQFYFNYDIVFYKWNQILIISTCCRLCWTKQFKLNNKFDEFIIDCYHLIFLKSIIKLYAIQNVNYFHMIRLFLCLPNGIFV